MNVTTTPQKENLTSRETGVFINRSEATLERWRRLRRGPPFLRVCGRVLYRVEDVRAWLDKQVQEPEAQQ